MPLLLCSRPCFSCSIGPIDGTLAISYNDTRDVHKGGFRGKVGSGLRIMEVNRIMKNSIKMDQTNTMAKKHKVSGTKSANELIRAYRLELSKIAGNMEPITVSRAVTHRRGKRLAKEQDESVYFSVPLRLLLVSRWQLHLREPRSWRRAFKVRCAAIAGAIAGSGLLQSRIDRILRFHYQKRCTQFQQAQGLSADGIAGPATLNRLNKRPKPKVRRCASWRS